MSFRISLRKSAAKFYENMDGQAKKAVKAKIDEMRSHTPIEGSVKLKGTTDTYRVRAGNFRILFQYDNSPGVIQIIAIGDRKDIYRGY